MKDKTMTTINPAVTVNLQTKATTFFFSIPPKTKATIQVLNADETGFINIPYDNNTGHSIGLPFTLAFTDPVSKIPTVVVG